MLYSVQKICDITKFKYTAYECFLFMNINPNYPEVFNGGFIFGQMIRNLFSHGVVCQQETFDLGELKLRIRSGINCFGRILRRGRHKILKNTIKMIFFLEFTMIIFFQCIFYFQKLSPSLVIS